jgi:hypothetical protein
MGSPGYSLQKQCDENYSIVETQILAGLVILHGKWSIVNQSGTGFTIGNYGTVFSSKIQAAMAGYLGIKGSDVVGSTAATYVMAIMGVSLSKVTQNILSEVVGANSALGSTTSSAAPAKPVGCA